MSSHPPIPPKRSPVHILFLVLTGIVALMADEKCERCAYLGKHCSDLSEEEDSIPLIQNLFKAFLQEPQDPVSSPTSIGNTGKTRLVTLARSR